MPGVNGQDQLSEEYAPHMYRNGVFVGDSPNYSRTKLRGRPKKEKKLQERVETEFREIPPTCWGAICSIPWSKSTRKLIGHLFADNGDTRADPACEGAWSRVMHANRLLIRYSVPFRIRPYELPTDQLPSPPTSTWICTMGIRLETVTKVL